MKLSSLFEAPEQVTLDLPGDELQMAITAAIMSVVWQTNLYKDKNSADYLAAQLLKDPHVYNIAKEDVLKRVADSLVLISDEYDEASLSETASRYKVQVILDAAKKLAGPARRFSRGQQLQGK